MSGSPTRVSRSPGWMAPADAGCQLSASMTVTSRVPEYSVRSMAARGLPIIGDPVRTRRCATWSREYCRTRMLACPLRSGGSSSLTRSGSSRWPNAQTMSNVPSTTGTPTTANSAKPKLPTPAACAASEMTTLTGLPVSSSSPPALPANARGMRSRDGGSDRRIAITTVIGSSAATVPLRPMRAVSPALSSMVSSSRRPTPSPALATSVCPPRWSPRWHRDPR